MTHTTRRRFGGLLTGGLVFGAGIKSRPAQGQTWPSKPITYIVPFPPGGTSDLTARLIGQEIGKGLGQPVVVENRAGANGNIGSAAVAKAPPDGYTLLLSGVGSNAINHGLYPKLPYDSRKDFAHVTILTRGPNVLVANAGFPAKSMRGFVELVKASPGKYNYASSGNGASGHMAMELLKMTAGLQVDHIPYKGGAPALTDVIAGQVPFMFVNQDVVIPHIKAGKLHPLGVARGHAEADHSPPARRGGQGATQPGGDGAAGLQRLRPRRRFPGGNDGVHRRRNREMERSGEAVGRQGRLALWKNRPRRL